MSHHVKVFSPLRAVVVCYHFTAEGAARPNYVARSLEAMPFLRRVDRVGSDYDHFQKARATEDAVTRLPVRPYAKNISLQRVFSYRDFARGVAASPLVTEADLVYVCVPDYLAALAVLRHRATRPFFVIVDVYDLWPEAFPLPPIANGLLKGILKLGIPALRRFLFRRANLILFQSGYFRERFGGRGPRYQLLPMCLAGRARAAGGAAAVSIREEIRVLFLGSINSITDTDSLVALLLGLAEQRRVSLCVIGGGIGWAPLEQRLAGTKIRVHARGVTFDRRIREEEIARAHFGFNGYKDTTEVSVSYKAIDYLQQGLPLINRTKGDLRELVARTGCGFNYDPREIGRMTEAMLALSDDDHRRLRENACRAFEENHSYEQFHATLRGYLEGLLAARSPGKVKASPPAARAHPERNGKS